MAKKNDARHRTTWGNRLRFLVRVLGITGLTVAVAGGVWLLSTALPLPTAPPAFLDSLYRTTRAAVDGANGPVLQYAGYAVVTGLGLAALALLVEAVGGLFLAAGRRTAAGTTSAVGSLAAVVLLVAVNWYSSAHYRRLDCTRDGQFTLPGNVADELRRLRPGEPTTIVVLQLHKTFGTLSDKRDSYVSEAERKVTEKVQDLADQFREFGPQFRVAVLDVEAFEYQAELAELTKDAPELRKAIEAAPENSIFFHSGKQVQRLGFNEFYQLDLTASQDADGGRSNLVLLPQGVENFARRVLTVEERKPRVGVMVIHKVLSTQESEGDETLTMGGVRKSLEANGFEVVDVLLKRWGNGPPSAAAYTFEENDLERAEASVNALNLTINRLRSSANEGKAFRKRIADTSLADLDKQFARAGVRFRVEDDRRRQLESIDEQLAGLAEVIGRLDGERPEAEAKLAKLLKSERAVEGRRNTSVKDKLAKLTAECDLLIVPRLTLINAVEGYTIRPDLYRLSKEQADVMTDFLAAGKPVLACFGPPVDRGPSLDPTAAADDFERALGLVGIEFGGQAILFDKEERAFAERQGEVGAAADVPPLAFDPPAAGKKPGNPIAGAMGVVGRAVNQRLDVKARGPRPVYLAPGWADKLPFAAEFVYTARESWNEARPLADDDYLPRYEPPKSDDPKKGTRDEERRGPFPVGVAVEAPRPVYSAAQAAAVVLAGAFLDLGGLGRAGPAAAVTTPEYVAGQGVGTVRVAAIGHGGLFTGSTLKPANEKLLLSTVNWLLGRADRLPKADRAAWQYPRVAMTEPQKFLWRAGTLVGLPAAALFLGLVVLMARKFR